MRRTKLVRMRIEENEDVIRMRTKRTKDRNGALMRDRIRIRRMKMIDEVWDEDKKDEEEYGKYWMRKMWRMKT